MILSFMQKDIMKNNWDFVLYDVNGEKIITVAFYNSFVDITRSFYLTKEEETYDFEELAKLSERIRNTS